MKRPMNETATAFSMSEGTAHTVASRLDRCQDLNSVVENEWDVRNGDKGIEEEGASFANLYES